jgi:hypothetical protein
MTLTGLALGLAAALALARASGSGVLDSVDRSADYLPRRAPLVVTAVASYVPARRAMRVDPISVLRE